MKMQYFIVFSSNYLRANIRNLMILVNFLQFLYWVQVFALKTASQE